MNLFRKANYLKKLDEKAIGQLCDRRLELIDHLETGLLNKEDFITENYAMMCKLSGVGFEVNSVEEGVLKYHYFNTMAKKQMLDADASEFRDPKLSSKLREKAYDLYLKKDKVTLNLLEFVEYQSIEAYFIHMNSKSLEGLIYEIRFNDHEKVVLHSKDRKILFKLKEANCFFDERKASVVNDYVNTKIY